MNSNPMKLPWRDATGRSGVFVVNEAAAMALINVAQAAVFNTDKDHAALSASCGEAMCWTCYMESNAIAALQLVTVESGPQTFPSVSPELHCWLGFYDDDAQSYTCLLPKDHKGPHMPADNAFIQVAFKP